MGILDFGAVVDRCGCVVGKLALSRQWVLLPGENCVNVFIHGEAASSFGVISCQFSFPILGDIIVFEESFSEVMAMMCAHIFNAKVVDNEREHVRAPLVVPEAGSGFIMVVSCKTEVLLKKFVGNFS